MEKRLLSLIMERIAADEELCEKVSTIDDAGFEALLVENGVEDIPAEERAKLLAHLKEYIAGEGELSDVAIDMVAGGSGFICGSGRKDSGCK